MYLQSLEYSSGEFILGAGNYLLSIEILRIKKNRKFKKFKN